MPNPVPCNSLATNLGLTFAQTDLPERIQGIQVYFLTRSFCCSANHSDMGVIAIDCVLRFLFLVPLWLSGIL